jgi:arabinose-5-phosphate isomerase
MDNKGRTKKDNLGSDTNSLSNSVTYGKGVIEEQIQALQSVTAKLDGSFADAVAALLSRHLNARIVVSGMGKAGFIGMKFSATLASVGCPSFFLHPADAIHGDLGRLHQEDITILFSHSGETDEINRLLPRIKSFGARIIAITASASSTLGQHSDIVIPIGKIVEAGPLQLAPTTSTTVMLALSDALAMTLLHQKGFSKEEYARFHPGGDLGRSLMLISDVMRQSDELCVIHESQITKQALRNITQTKGRPGGAAVVDNQGKLIGVFTDGDLRRQLESDIEFLTKPIGSVCSRSPISLPADHLAQEACRIIQDREIDQLFIVDEENKPIGMIDIQDLLAIGMIRPE